MTEHSLTLTAKRQATLPKLLCDELHVQPGDRIVLVRRVVNGEVLWALRPKAPDLSWIGSAAPLVTRVPSEAEIEDAIARAAADDDRESIADP